MHRKTRTGAAAAFLCKAHPVPQPCRTVRAERQEWVLGTRKSLAEEEGQNQLSAKRSLLLQQQVRGGILRLSSSPVHGQMERRKGKQTPSSVAQSGVSAASQAPSLLAAIKWRWFIYNSHSDWGRTWRNWDVSTEGTEWGDVHWGRTWTCINPSRGGDWKQAMLTSLCHQWGWWQRSKGHPSPNEWGQSGATTRAAFGTEDASRGRDKLLLEVLQL